MSDAARIAPWIGDLWCSQPAEGPERLPCVERLERRLPAGNSHLVVRLSDDPLWIGERGVWPA